MTGDRGGRRCSLGVAEASEAYFALRFLMGAASSARERDARQLPPNDDSKRFDCLEQRHAATETRKSTTECTLRVYDMEVPVEGGLGVELLLLLWWEEVDSVPSSKLAEQLSSWACWIHL